MNQEENSPVEADDEISLLDLIEVISKNLRLLILGPILAGLTALSFGFYLPPSYTAKSTFLPPQQQGSSSELLQSLGSLGGLVGSATGIKNPSDRFISYLKSNTLRDRLIKRFSLKKYYKSEFITSTREALNSKVNIITDKAGLITVEVKDEDPIFAAKIANAHIEELSVFLTSMAITEAQDKRVFYENQLRESVNKLSLAQQNLQKSGVQAGDVMFDPTTAVASVARLQAEITSQEIRVSSMRGYVSEKSPDYQQALTELKVLKHQLAKIESGYKKTNNNDVNYLDNYREFKIQQTLYELLVKQFEMAKLDEARKDLTIQVIDPALPPELKNGPKKAQMATLTSLATGFFLLLWVFIKNAINSGYANPESSKKMTSIRNSIRKSLGLKANS